MNHQPTRNWLTADYNSVLWSLLSAKCFLAFSLHQTSSGMTSMQRENLNMIVSGGCPSTMNMAHKSIHQTLTYKMYAIIFVFSPKWQSCWQISFPASISLSRLVGGLLEVQRPRSSLSPLLKALSPRKVLTHLLWDGRILTLREQWMPPARARTRRREWQEGLYGSYPPFLYFEIARRLMWSFPSPTVLW